MENFNSIVTNPLTWDALKPRAPRKANDGSIFNDFNTIIPGVADAEAKQKVLWIDTKPLSGQINTKNFHVLDYGLFYVDVRKNAKQRVNAFTQNNIITKIASPASKDFLKISLLQAEC